MENGSNFEETNKEKILNAAVKLFAQKGFDGTSIREICSIAGVNISLISYYFGSKGELYDFIISDLIKRQTEYTKTFADITKDPSGLSKKEQIELLFLLLDKFINFFYSNAVSKDLIILFLKEQQNLTHKINSPALQYLRKVIAQIFEKDVNDPEMIFRTLFITSQINSAKILSAYYLKLLNQSDYTENDIQIIRENIKFYINTLLKEAGIV